MTLDVLSHAEIIMTSTCVTSETPSFLRKHIFLVLQRFNIALDVENVHRRR